MPRLLMVTVLGILLLVCSCSSSPAPVQRTIPSLSGDVLPGKNESEVLVQNDADLGLLDILIDGEIVAQVDQSLSERVIIHNGNHSIVVQQAGGDGPKSDAFEFAVSSKRIVFDISSVGALKKLGRRIFSGSSPITISRQGEFDIGATPIANRVRQGDAGIEGSLGRAAAQIMEKLSPKTKVAIVYVTSNDQEIAEYIANELEFIMVNREFMVIDRSQLDQLRKEQNFQLGGEVDDNTAVSIGKVVGANVIITGSVTGTGDLRRLRLRALNTQTGQVMAVTAERY
jgi:hypothetical protein